MPIEINKHNNDTEYHNINSLQDVENPFVCENVCECCPIIEDRSTKDKRKCWCGIPFKFLC